MKLKDCRGLELSTANRVALAHYERAVDLLHGYRIDPLSALDDAITEDPGFVMAHCTRAGLMLLFNERSVDGELRRSLTQASTLAHHATDRERAHLAAAQAWADGDIELSLRRYGQILMDHPQDTLALQIAHTGDFFLGQSQMLRDRIAWVLPQWSREQPGYGYLLGMHAFGLEECADYARAEAQGRAALELNPKDAWAVHAVAHVMEMQGRIGEGMAWLDSREADWAPDNFFAYHNAWHRGLFQMEQERYDGVLALYDSQIRPQRNPVAMEMVDASAMLWRLHLRGVALGARATELADDWRPATDGFYAFNDVHALLAFIMAERWADAETVLATLRQAAAGSGSNARMSREVGLPVARALLDFAQHRYADAAEGLLAVRHLAHRYGGSHAQRDLLFLTCVEAALRADRGTLARALAAERTDVKPGNPFNWRLTGRALQLTGDQAGAEAASARAQQQVHTLCAA